MNDHRPAPTPGATGLWRVVLLDRSADDPRWIIATVGLPSDVRPAELDAIGRYTGWEQVTRWVRDALGHDVELIPVTDPLAWTVREPGSPR
jgi:hypothetical protein